MKYLFRIHTRPQKLGTSSSFFMCPSPTVGESSFYMFWWNGFHSVEVPPGGGGGLSIETNYVVEV